MTIASRTGAETATPAAAGVDAYGSLLVCVALWGLIFPGSAQLLLRIDAVQVVTLRFMIVSISFLLIYAARPGLIPRLTPREWLLALLCGVLAVPGAQLTLVHAQNYLSAPLAALFPTFAPAIAAVCAACFFRERLGRNQIIGFALALAGVVLILVVGAGTGASAHANSPLGAAAGLLSPLSWALYTLAVRPLFSRGSSLGIVGIVYVLGTLILIPAFPSAIGALSRLTTSDWLWLIAMGTIGTVAPNVTWLVGLRRLTVSQTTVFMYLIPISAIVWTLATTGKAPQPVALPGGLLVIAGVAFTQRGRRAEPSTPSPAVDTSLAAEQAAERAAG